MQSFLDFGEGMLTSTILVGYCRLQEADVGGYEVVPDHSASMRRGLGNLT